eukprot:scaffold124500_cov58-Phaeocystis_antarctica.AAC.1
MSSSPCSTTTAATPKEDAPPWNVTPCSWSSSRALRITAAWMVPVSALNCRRALANGRRITAPSSPTMLTSLATTKSLKCIGSVSVAFKAHGAHDLVQVDATVADSYGLLRRRWRGRRRRGRWRGRWWRG